MTPSRHIVTGEFPPASGGVADYTAAVARALAAAGEDVHVWCGGRDAAVVREDGVSVHRVLGTFDRDGLAAADARMAALPGPKRLLVQWVPHAYGRRSINLAFCRWAQRRVRRHGDRLDVMVHEPFLAFAGGMRQVAAAAVHRLMVRVLLGAATKICVGTTAWEPLCRPYAHGAPIAWTPVPSGIPVTTNAAAAAEARLILAVPAGATLVGAFGRFAANGYATLAEAFSALRASVDDAVLLLIGIGSEAARASIVRQRPELASRIRASGLAPADQVSLYLQACDLLVQPYPDGVCGRHSCVAAALAHGCAIVTTEGPFTEPVWRESGAVRLAPARDRQRLTAAVIDLARDARARACLGERAVALYDTQFHVRHTVAALQVSEKPTSRSSTEDSDRDGEGGEVLTLR